MVALTAPASGMPVAENFMNGGLLIVKRALSAFYAHDDRYMIGDLPEYFDTS